MTSPRGWFSKRPPPKDPISNERQQIHHVDVSKGAFKFNTFAAVMGKKPKKPSPAFQDHPTITPISDNSHPVRYTNRPPSKSISSTVRSGDSSEPLTPSDTPKDRISFTRSVFTLSDADPFAAGAISVPQSIADSSSFSVFSSSSGNDAFSKKNDHLLSFDRSSFASTSSLSHDVHYSTTSPLLPDPPQRSMAPLLENLDLDITRENGSSDRWGATIRPPLSKSGSFATLTDKTSSESHAPRIRRPRGYTESSSSRPTTASSHVPRQNSNHFEIAPPLTHKLSNSRLVTQPPSAPPDHDLPPTPLAPLGFDNSHEVPPTLSSLPSSVLSTMTNGLGNSHNARIRISNNAGLGLASSDETKKSTYRPKDPPRCSLADIFVQRPCPRSPILPCHTLKKSMSHSTLQKTTNVDEPNPPASAGHPKSSDRDLKKQNSLQPQSPSSQTRQPNTLFTSNPFHPSASETSLPSESKRSITNSPPVTVRRRLFSSSSNRRPSLVPTEDDSQSVFSLPSTEAERAQGMTSLYTSSLLDEADSDALPSGVVAPAPDYAQQIMSPAEMLKVEAMVQSEFDSKYGEVLRTRQRNASFTSASTPSLAPTNTKEGLSMPPTSFPRFKGPCGSGSPLSATRPSTAEDRSPSSLPHSHPSLSQTGLPPPPRVRSRPHTTETTQSDLSGRRLSTLPANPLSPPPRKRTPRVSTSGGDKPPVRSVMRKPSFLEINDDASSYDGSFLDLGKDSLDLSVDEN